VIVDVEFIVNARLEIVPLTGTLPLPVQPVVMYRTPVPALTGELTCAAMVDPELNQPLLGVGVSCEEVTVRKYR